MSNLIPPGPFPRSGREDELEQESIRAFRNLLPIKSFRFRDERADDKGVDGSLELLVDGDNLNIRAQVQLKGTDLTTFNEDGSFSLPVATSNLNYLLEGPSPFYVLYISPLDELRLVWVRDEVQRIEQTNPTWPEQGKVSIRFSNKVVAVTLDEVRTRILREAKFSRDTVNAVRSAAGVDRVALSIDPATLRVDNALEALAILEDDGIQFVSRGEAQEVLELFQTASPIAVGRSKANLVAGYALFVLGRYSETIGHLAKINLASDSLSKEDSDLRTYLSAVADFHLGRITGEALSARLGVLAETAESEFSLMLTLESARRKAYENKMATISELELAINAIMSSPIAGAGLRFQAQLVSLTISGLEVAHGVAETLSILRSRVAIGVNIDRSADLATMRRKESEWHSAMAMLLAAPLARRNQQARADALCLRLQIQFSTLLAFDTLSETGPHFSEPGPLPIIADVAADIEEALEIYKGGGSIEGELRANLIHANFLELAGRIEEAKEIARPALARADAIGYGDMSDSAQQILTGTSPVGMMVAARKYVSDVDEDVRIASGDPAQLIKSLAPHALASLQLPQDRLPQLQEEAKSFFIDSTARVNWCRHIQLVQRLDHTLLRSTAYKDPLEWRCRCVARYLESDRDRTDIEETVRDFKANFCIGCALRSPKVAAPE